MQIILETYLINNKNYYYEEECSKIMMYLEDNKNEIFENFSILSSLNTKREKHNEKNKYFLILEKYEQKKQKILNKYNFVKNKINGQLKEIKLNTLEIPKYMDLNDLDYYDKKEELFKSKLYGLPSFEF